jgi:signal transduction histidine kinase
VGLIAATRDGDASELSDSANGRGEAMSAAARVAAARDAERRRIEQNLHDGAQQRLAAVRLGLGMVSELLDTSPAGARSKLAEVRSELDEALEELRELAHGLYPRLLASDGLHVALAAAARRSAIPVTLQTRGLSNLPLPIESAAYFCCLEALQNASKHAGDDATAALRVTAEDRCLAFKVIDDGIGFEVGRISDGYGLSSMRDRVLALGGEVRISSAKGHGTTVAGRIPLPRGRPRSASGR